MTAERLKEIAERAAKATPGPWDADTKSPHDCVIWGAGDSEFLGNVGSDSFTPVGRCVEFDVDIANAEFIAHARADIPDLLAHIQALEEALLYCIDNIDGCIQGRDLPSTVIRDKARAALSPAPATKGQP